MLLASVCVLGFHAPAWAQTAGPAADQAATAAVNDYNTIIVTATRRAQALSEVPVAVSAVSAESLERSGVSDIRQLNQLAPSLLVSSTTSDASTSARIRGIGTVGDNAGLESSVAVFIDGVYRVRNGAGLTELGDIERIEVLRGPQGTLFGRNASAGLINVITKKPGFDVGAAAEATYGNYNYLRLAGHVTGPLVADTLAARFDAVYSKRDGFLEDPETGFEMNDRDRYLLRGQMLFTPNDNLEMRLIADYAKTDEHCCGATFQPTVETFVDPDTGQVATRPNPFVPLMESLGGRYNFNTFDREIAVTEGREPRSPTRDWGLSLQADWDLGAASLTSITAYRDYRSQLYGDTDFTNVDILYRDPGSGRHFKTFSQELRLQGHALDDRLDWLVGGYFADESLEVIDRLKFGSDYGQFATCRLLPEAVRILGVPGCRVPQTTAIISGLSGAHGANIIEGLDLLEAMNNVGDDNSLFKQDSQNWALFTHNVYSITDKLSLTLGVRYTEETKKVRAEFENSNTFCPNIKQALAPVFGDPAANPTAQALAGGLVALGCQGGSTAELNGLELATKRKDKEWTGTGVLSYQFDRNLMTYASYAKGYKAGGFNLDRSALGRPGATLTNDAAENIKFDPEKVDSYEIGLKYSGGSFSLNVAAFRQLFKNFQLNTFNGQFYFVQTINGCSDDLGGADRDASALTGACDADNVRAGVLSKGVEVEAVAYPTHDITVSAGLTLTDTKYRNNLVGGASGVPLDPVLFLLPGQRLSNAPKYVVTGSVAYTPLIGNSGMSALFYADFRHASDYNTGSDLFPEKAQDGYTVVNARVGLYGAERRWGLELWAQNLFNVNYKQVGFNAPFQGSNSAAQAEAFGVEATQMFTNFLAEPRTYGLTFKVRY
ncbi:MAG TPA: TonB-dependent receptor [Pedomonas sp.]|nr:TonB-dependent receptor [Pedomonas sp.]